MAAKVGPAGHVYATEMSERSRDAIRARASGAGLKNVTVLTGAPDATNLPPACCEVIFLRNVYHHVREPDAFARSLRAAVRPGGRVAVLDFEPGELWFHGGRPDDTSERRPGHGVSRADVIAELSNAGLVLEQEIARWSGPMWLLLFRAGDRNRH
jgi:SAM-dependent methyltransferase